MQNEEVSLAAGAIKGWDRRSFYYFGLLKAVAEHYGFDLETPFGQLPKKYQNIILNGTKEEIEFVYVNDRGDKVKRKHAFEGVLNNMARRYKETESNSVREELAKYINNRPCMDCEGSRLRREARYVFLDKTNLPMVSEKVSARH